MKVETSDLIGDALDYAVCLAERDEVGAKILRFQCASNYRKFSPSTDWAYGGPIIERERITVGPWDTSPFAANLGVAGNVSKDMPRMVGPEPLVAAMRCWVYAVFGDTIDIPDEILNRSKPCA